jgi:hypothetical protein
MLVKHRLALALIGVVLPALGMPQIIKLPDGGAQVVVPRDGPGRGMTKAQVERRYGEPISRTPVVGNPPISRWNYPDDRVTSTAIWCCIQSPITPRKHIICM